MCDVVGKRLARFIIKTMKPSGIRRDPVEALPEEILHLIWRLLDLKDLLNASLVSSKWHASLSTDNVWKKYTETLEKSDKKKIGQYKKMDKGSHWKKRFLSQRSLIHNWSKNRYNTFIKTPLIGKVVSTESELCVWRDKSVAIMSPLNAVVTNQLRLPHHVESVITCPDSDLLLVTTQSRNAFLFRSSSDSSEPLLVLNLDQFEKRAKLTSKYLCRCTCNKLILYDLKANDIVPREIQLPDLKNLNSYHLLNSCILIRFEPLDYNYEAIFSLYDFNTQQWSVISKITASQLGNREHFVFTYHDFYLVLNYLLVDDIYMYSNVYLYHKDKALNREIISNCKRKYFTADFARDICLFTVADYRLSAVDLVGLKAREIYVTASFKALNTVLNRFFVLSYSDKLEVWDIKYWKRLYIIKMSDRDKVIIRDEFISVISWPGTSLPPSLRIINFTQPELTQSPSPSTFDLSNIFI